MKKAAFKLVATVIFLQSALLISVLAGCFFTRDSRCTGDRAHELATFITAQAFALYAAEK
jgi:hypothetical protein